MTTTTTKQVDRAFERFEQVVGADAVLRSGADLDLYQDPYPTGDLVHAFRPCGAVAPASTEQVQAIVRIANELRVPLWTCSNGRNLGYGGQAPRLPGTVVLDLCRMKRILEVDEKLGYALVEPGVSFFDLHQYIQRQGIKLWLSVPALGWGSVIGNALERGFGYTAYGDHASMQCGMEVVLANGELLRTGMGAMEGSSSWQLFKPGFGPSLDGLFMQSNLGVVTRMGIWLMPEPESWTSIHMQFEHEDDLGAIVETMRPLRMAGTVQNQAVIAGPIRSAALQSTRHQWYRGPGAMPDDAIRRMVDSLGIGFWNVRCAVYGNEEMCGLRTRLIRSAFERIPGLRFSARSYRAGEEIAPPDRSQAGIPSLGALGVTNWYGGNGGHTAFSPISPPTREDAVRQYEMVRARAREFEIDYFGGFAVGERYLNHIFIILYDQQDRAQVGRVDKLFHALVEDAARHGYGEYRTHLAYMDLVSQQYGFERHALRRFVEALKDTLDPHGILSPGKQGIWPSAMRGPGGAPPRTWS
jgi:4-cresol dehydrogenase (hydroxylating) flavoprotein subunit